MPARPPKTQMSRVPSLRIVAALLAIYSTPAHAQLAGHGGPVRAIAVSADGDSVLSGSFDTAGHSMVAQDRIRRTSPSVSL